VHTILEGVLTGNELTRVREIIADAAYVDGRMTSVVAGKKNLQLPLGSAAAERAGAIVLEALDRHDSFNLAVHPVAIHRPLFSRYEPGMQYPDHIDVAVMGRVRADVAVTLFLSNPEEYEGGDLVVDSGLGVRRYRLPAGDGIAYPASTVHHIAPVTRGVRLVCVLWIQSLVRHPAHRVILFDLALLTRSLGETSCASRLHRSYWNLLRMWGDTSPGWSAP
jgi:PKHD-type hydroxylase